MKKAIILLLILPFFFACTDGSSDSSKPEEKKPTEQTKPEPPKGCTSNAECADGKVCNTVTGMCEEETHELKENGCDCSSNVECKSGYCVDQKCGERPETCVAETYAEHDGCSCVNGYVVCE